MGKKKHKHRKHDRHEDGAPPFVIPPQVAGIAAAAIEQVNTPAFRQMVAGALGAAAQAFDQRRRPVASPAAGPPAAEPAHAESLVVEPDRASADAAGIRLSPEATQAIEQAASQAARAVEGVAALASQAIGIAAGALERWAAEQQARPAAPADWPGVPPQG